MNFVEWGLGEWVGCVFLVIVAVLVLLLIGNGCWDKLTAAIYQNLKTREEWDKKNGVFYVRQIFYQEPKGGLEIWIEYRGGAGKVSCQIGATLEETLRNITCEVMKLVSARIDYKKTHVQFDFSRAILFLPKDRFC